MADAGERNSNVGSSFRNFNISGNARVHAGHNFYNAPAPDDPDEIRRALYETDPEIDRQNLMQTKGGRVHGTCRWIVENDQFKAWVRGDIGVLSISGGPGKGKSMLADFIISKLAERCTLEDNATLTYFFCLNADTKRNNTASILRGLLYHLVRTYPKLSPYLQPELGSPERRSTVVSSPDILWSILIAMVDGEDTGTMFCVVDGLDECNQDAYVFLRRKLSELRTRTQPHHRLRIAILSRPSHAFGMYFPEIKLDPDNDEHVSHDLSLYITSKLAELEDFIRLDGTSRQELYDQLAYRAKGTFLWVGFAIEELMRQKTLTRAKKRLQEIPPGLPALYTRMLQQIPEDCKASCLVILRWVAIGMRPLRVHEMAGALHPEICGHASDEQVSEVEDLVTECGSLVVITEKCEVVVVHQSARDFLLSLRTGDPLEYWGIDPVQSNVDLLRACFECVDSSSYQYEVPDKQAPEPLLFKYARDYLAEHARVVPDSASEIFQHPFFFDNNRPARNKLYINPRSWTFYDYVEGCWKIRSDNLWPRDDGKMKQYWIACHLGVLPWITYLFKQRVYLLEPPSLEGADGESLLRIAAEEGHTNVIDILLQNSVDPNTTDQHGRSVLHCSDSVDVVRILLRHQATNIDLRDNTGRTALFHHRRYQDDKMMCLIESKATVDLADNDGMTPLMFAACNSPSPFPDVVLMLLKAGAPTCSIMHDGSTVLHVLAQGVVARWNHEGFALSSDHVTVGKLLMDHGADIQALDCFGRTSLDVLCDGVFASVDFWQGRDRLRPLATLITEDAWRRLAMDSTCSPVDIGTLFRSFVELLNPLNYAHKEADVMADDRTLSRALAKIYRYWRYIHSRDLAHSTCGATCTSCSHPTGYIRHEYSEVPDAAFCTSCVKRTSWTGIWRTLGCSGNVLNEDEGWWPYCCAECHKQIYVQLYRRGEPGLLAASSYYCANCAVKIQSPSFPLEGSDIFNESRRLLDSDLVRSFGQDLRLPNRSADLKLDIAVDLRTSDLPCLLLDRCPQAGSLRAAV